MNQPWPPQQPMQPPQPPMQQPYQPMQPPGGPGLGPGYPYQPGFPPPRRGSGVKAFLFAWLISGFAAMLFAGIQVAAYEDLSKVGLRVMYIVFALALALVIGLVAGKTGGPNPGAYVVPSLFAMLACLMGTANGFVFVLMDAGGSDALEAMMEHDMDAPLQFWWEGLNEGIALLGLAVAGGGTFGMASLIGKKQPQ